MSGDRQFTTLQVLLPTRLSKFDPRNGCGWQWAMGKGGLFQRSSWEGDDRGRAWGGGGSFRCSCRWCGRSRRHRSRRAAAGRAELLAKKHRSQVLQGYTHSKALDKIYKTCMFLHRSNLSNLATVLQTFSKHSANILAK